MGVDSRSNDVPGELDEIQRGLVNYFYTERVADTIAWPSSYVPPTLFPVTTKVVPYPASLFSGVHCDHPRRHCLSHIFCDGRRILNSFLPSNFQCSCFSLLDINRFFFEVLLVLQFQTCIEIM